LIADRGPIYLLFKYAVYALLTLNIFLFFREEWAAAAHRFSDGVGLADVIEAFAATIDTAAWVVLLLMFELETYVLSDDRFTPVLTRSLHGLRTISYLFIVYAFYGYLSKLLFLVGAAPLAGVSDPCALVDGTWSYAVDLDEYVVLTVANCSGFPATSNLLQLPGLDVVVDPAGLTGIVRLAWTDVINSAVWLLIVLVLEIDVRLQERGMLEGLFLRISNLGKLVLYAILFLAAVYWGVKGDFVDFWDAFLWLVAFVFIEMNVFDWRHEALDERLPARAADG